MLELVPMVEADFRCYMKTAVDDYAQAHIRAGDCDPAEAHKLAQADYDQLLPDGLASAGQHLFSLRIAGTDESVGMVWFAIRERNARKTAFIYDIQIVAAQRGRGHGAEALLRTEELAASMGAWRIGLNVMGWNHVARRLYEKAGFTITGMGMVKALT